MRVHFVTPVPPGSNRGNGITARRWSQMVAQLGHEVDVLECYDGRSCDVLIALHARRSYDSIRRFADDGRGTLMVALTGTDAYGDLPGSIEANESLVLADRIIALQDHAHSVVPQSLRSKVHTVIQSAEELEFEVERADDAFTVAVVGHLRPVKDPFLCATAVRDLPATSDIQVVQVGAALDSAMADTAAREQEENSRYTWVGEVTMLEARRHIAAADLIALTSKMEGGANVISEAIVSRIPVISTRIGGSIGMLGSDYAGFFEVGDVDGLRAVLERCESDASFTALLRAHGDALREQFLPAAELEAWRLLFSGLR